ncbi:rhodanese-like domain-containing protein [Daejeonella sp.]|uniref:rhodanese-like domain-containing protein n=1 Tax=Daejeonella sp. TaxID=2805397 RepID=UPI0030BE8E78
MNKIHSLRRGHYLLLTSVFIAFSFSFNAEAQIPQSVPASLDKPNLWEAKDLIQPAELASILANKKNKMPAIFNIGVVEDIEGAKRLGAASKKDNLENLKDHLSKLPKMGMVVIYCGCCPFEKCPNIRPAFALMKDMGFVNGRLLNIPVNLKQNWISKGYPMLSQRQI